MEQKYRDAVFAGLKCGVVLAGLYVINMIAGRLLSSATAIEPYLIFEILVIVLVATVVIGFPITGVYALRSGERRKNTVNHIVTIGAIAGIAALIPLLVLVVILDIYLIAIGNPFSPLSPGSPVIPGMTLSGLGLNVVCCLPQCIIIRLSFPLLAHGAMRTSRNGYDTCHKPFLFFQAY